MAKKIELATATKILAQAQAAEGAARTALSQAQAALFFAEADFRDAVSQETSRQARDGRLGPAAEAAATK